MKKYLLNLALLCALFIPAFALGNGFENELNEYLMAQQSPEMIELMSRIGIFVAILFYIALPIPILILLFKGTRKNWNEKKKKEKSVGYAGYWKRVAIKHLDKVLSIFIVPIVLNIYFYFRDGQTLGDKILGGKIVDKKTHEVASVGKLFIRVFAKFISTIAFGVGYWPAGWRKEKNAWHDSLSDTRYISTKRLAGGWVVLIVILGGAILAGVGSWQFWLPSVMQ